MKRLPHIDSLTAQILQRVEQEAVAVKTATVKEPEYTVEVAKDVHKLAQCLRESDADCVTHADVQHFATNLMRHVR